MEILAKFPMEFLVLMLAVSASLFAQRGGRSLDEPLILVCLLDATQIVEPSIAATERR